MNIKNNTLRVFRLFVFRILRCIFLSLLIFCGCSENEELLSLNLDTDTLAFECEAGSQEVKVSSSGDWSVSGETNWCKVSPETAKGNTTVTVTVQENDSPEERKATLIFTSGTKNAKVEIIQAEKLLFETNYKNVDWATSVITKYDENTGVINIQYQGTAPSFKENNAIVLPEDYRCEVRVVKSSTVSGNTVTLQTERGNICNLFMNVNFTLATDPSLSSLRSSDGGKIITPSEIGVMTENGYKAIYRKGEMLRSSAEYGADFNIFSFNKDYSGTDLYNKNGHRAFWERCSFDFGLKGVFSFDFGRKIDDKEDKLPIGDLKKFDFYLDGKLNIDLLLKYVYTAQFKESKENLIKKNVLPMMTVKFVVGTVPVVIFIDTHLYNRYDLEANAEVTLSAGCNIQAQAKMGLSCTREGISPITSFTSSFTLYDPIFTAKGSLKAKGSIYPRVEFEIYKCLAPWVEPMPYLREDLGAGMRTSTDGNNYLAWTSKSYAGLDCRMGIKMDFGMLIPFIDIWTSDIYNPIDYLLFDAPKKIGLNSPADGTKSTVGNPVDVSFYISSFNNITKNYYPCLGGLVNFSTQGNVNKSFAVANKDGLVTVQWTPKSKNDVLTAKIVDKDGQTINEATFTPKYEDSNSNGGDWVLINGVKWATRNVGAPNTFVQNPEDYGNYYQFNKGTTDFQLYDAYNYDSTVWQISNDPSPNGYRVPTSAELESLYNTPNVWITQNGINGRKFTDRTSGKVLFLPAAGYRNSGNGKLLDVGSSGYYWGSTQYLSYLSYAINMPIDSGGVRYNGNNKANGQSVRSVAE